jgi:hypothetical protein
LRAINSALAKRDKLRDIASRSGFSKSAIGRHSQKCMPQKILNDYRDAQTTNGRSVVCWPDVECAPPALRAKLMADGKEVLAGDLRHDDSLFLVQYAPLFLPEPLAETEESPIPDKPETKN